MSKDEKITGRTPWDFAADFMKVLGRVGPSAIVVAGFLFFAYFFYQEINKARVEVDQQMQQRLQLAQNQLVETYEKIGGLSDQLIENINSLMDLNKKIDKDVELSRQKLLDLESKAEEELRKAEKDSEEAIAEAEEAKLKLESLKIKFKQQEQELESRMKELDRKRKDIEIKVATLEEEKNQMEAELAARAKQIAQIKKETPSYSPHEVTRVLKAYASNPKSVSSEDLNVLIGIESEKLKKILEDVLGYSLWIYWQNKIFSGYTLQSEVGYGPYLLINTASDLVSNVISREGYYLIKLPKVKNWYESWGVAIRPEGNIANPYYFDQLPSDEWSLTLLQGLPGLPMIISTLVGTDTPKKILSPEEFRSKFPELYSSWSVSSDPLGRPKLNLRMLHRAERFTPSQVPGLSTMDFPPGLRQALELIYEASVKENPEAAKEHLGAEITQLALGQLASIILSDGARIADVKGLSTISKTQQEKAESFEILMDYRYGSEEAEVKNAGLVFSKFGNTWVLTAIKP